MQPPKNKKFNVIDIIPIVVILVFLGLSTTPSVKNYPEQNYQISTSEMHNKRSQKSVEIEVCLSESRSSLDCSSIRQSGYKAMDAGDNSHMNADNLPETSCDLGKAAAANAETMTPKHDKRRIESSLMSLKAKLIADLSAIAKNIVPDYLLSMTYGSCPRGKKNNNLQ